MPEQFMAVPPLALLGSLLLCLLAGAVLGLFFFGGLWWSTRRAAAAAQPAMWLLASLLLRMGVVLVGFHLVGAGQWPRLLACLAGFVLARVLVLRRTRPALAEPAPPTQKASHAP